MAFNKAKVLEDIQKYVQRGQIDKAIEEYERVLKIDPRDYKLRQKLGDLYLRKGKNAEAVNQYIQVAEYYIKDGFYLKAIALYSQILRTDPSKLSIYEKLAELYKKQGLIGEAVARLRILAEIYEKQRNLSDAMQSWEKIINLDPDNVIYRGKLVEFYLKQGLATRAEEKLRQAVDYFKSKGRYDEVEKLMSHFPGVLEEDKTVVLNLARTLFSEGKYIEALEKLDQYIKANIKDSEAYFLKASCYLNINQFNLAKHSFEMCLKIAPLSTDARKGLLKIYAKEKNWSQLILLIEELFKIYSNNKAYDDFKAIIDNYYPYLPEEKRLLSIYIELFRITGDLKPLKEKLKKLANVYLNEGNKDEATKLYKEVLSLDPKDDDAVSFFKLSEPEIVKDEKIEPAKKEVTKKSELIIVEDLTTISTEESSLDKELYEVSNLLKFGLLSKAKEKLEELSTRFPDTLSVKEMWLEYFDITKDKEAYIIVLKEIINICKKYENAEKLVYYERLLNEEIIEKAHSKAAVNKTATIEEADIIEDIEEAEIATPNIDDLLIEADFYYKNEMLKEAQQFYEKVLEVDPENVVAKQRLQSINKVNVTTIETKPVIVTEKKPKEAAETDFYDLSGEIMKELEKESLFEATFKSETERISFEELLKEFKNKISQEIEEGDVETHYNLGIAYKEMGLYDDAIQEFILTSRFPQKTYDSYIMVATCLSEKKDYEKAAQFFKRALSLPDVEKEKKAGIYLELGNIYENLEMFEKAIISFNKAASIDNTLRIAKEKINNILLEKPELANLLSKDDLDI